MNELIPFTQQAVDKYLPLKSAVGVLSVASSVSKEHAHKHLRVFVRAFVGDAKTKDELTQVSWTLFIRPPSYMRGEDYFNFITLNSGVYARLIDGRTVFSAIASAISNLENGYVSGCYEVALIEYIPKPL